MEAKSIVQAGVVAREATDDRLTFGGLLEVCWPSDRRAGKTLRTLGGRQLRFGAPADWTVRTSGAAIELEFRGSVIGLERSPRGTALINLLQMGEDVKPTDIVDHAGGLLAHYELNRDRLHSETFTLWQGRHSDIYSWGMRDISAAVHQFASLTISDIDEGATIKPPRRWTVYRDFLHIDCDPWFIEIHGAEAGFRPPGWSGHRGKHISLYSFSEGANEDQAQGGLYAYSDSAGAVIRKLEGRISDSEVASISEGLSLTWLELTENPSGYETDKSML